MRRDDENLTLAEKRVIFLKRYGLVGFLSLLSPMLLPIGMEWIASKVMDARLAPLERKLDSVYEEILYSRAYASEASMQTMVTADDWNIMVRHRVRSQLLDKINEVKIALAAYPDRSTEEAKKRLWTKIKNILYSNTSIYINELKGYGHPVVGNIGLYLARSFPMYADSKREYRPNYSFLHIVYKITIETKETDIEVIAENLEEYMKAIQDEYFTYMYKKLKRLEAKVR